MEALDQIYTIQPRLSISFSGCCFFFLSRFIDFAFYKPYTYNGSWHLITNLSETRSALFEPFDLNKFCVVNDVMHRKFNKRTRMTDNTTIVDMLGKPSYITLRKRKYILPLDRVHKHSHTHKHLHIIVCYNDFYAYLCICILMFISGGAGVSTASTAIDANLCFKNFLKI